MASVRHFLLDQNFPNAPLKINQLDASVTYVHMSEQFPELSQVSTPDWLVLLKAAHHGGFDGVVSRDAAQVRQGRELVALQRTELSVVTWRRKIEDAIAEWGQLLAYMPQVSMFIDQHGPHIFLLPDPRIRADMVEKASELAHLEAKKAKEAYGPRRTQAIEYMASEVNRRGMPERESLLRA